MSGRAKFFCVYFIRYIESIARRLNKTARPPSPPRAGGRAPLEAETRRAMQMHSEIAWERAWSIGCRLVDCADWLCWLCWLCWSCTWTCRSRLLVQGKGRAEVRDNQPGEISIIRSEWNEWILVVVIKIISPTLNLIGSFSKAPPWASSSSFWFVFTLPSSISLSAISFTRSLAMLGWNALSVIILG